MKFRKEFPRTLFVALWLTWYFKGSTETTLIDICPKQLSSTTIINSCPLTDTNESSIVFSVKLCGSLRVTLTGNHNSSSNIVRYYGLIIDQYGTSLFKQIDNSEKVTFHDSLGDTILNCSSYQSFWISWEEYLTFGYGNTVFQNGKEHYALDNRINVDWIGIESSNVNNQDRWRIKIDPYAIKLRESVRCSNPMSIDARDDIFIDACLEQTTSTAVTDNIQKVQTDSPECNCSNFSNRWSYLCNRNLTSEQLRQELSENIKELTGAISINTKQTKKYLATKVSAPDNRILSKSIGWVAALVIASVPVLALINDVLSCAGKPSKIKQNK